LTCGQLFYLFFDFGHVLGLGEHVFRALALGCRIGRGIDFQKIKVLTLGFTFKLVEIGEQGVFGLLPSEPIEGRVGENALKQHGQLGDAFVAVMLAQLHHAVLNNIERGLLVPHMVERAFEGSFFNADQKVREFLFGGQSEAVFIDRCRIVEAFLSSIAAQGAIGLLFDFFLTSFFADPNLRFSSPCALAVLP